MARKNKELLTEETTDTAVTQKKAKKAKKVKTKEQKLRRKKTRLIVATVIFGVFFLFFITVGATTKIGSDALIKSVENVTAVDYTGINRIMPVLDAEGKPVLDENGCYTFKDEKGELDTRNFRVLQLTDIHIGAGAFSIRTDAWTVQTVVDLVQKTKPDLVVATGDIAYPVFFQSATLNNQKEARVFATMMENLGVYWTFEFGNHDTELYSSYTREDIGAFYANTAEFPHCLFNNEKKKVNGKEIMGQGNFAINLLDKNNELVHTMFMVDSNAYLEDDPMGAKWHYDRIHDDQIEWYEQMAKKIGLVDEAGNRNAKAKSTMYFHIPIKEFNEVFFDYQTSVNKNKESIMGLSPEKVNPPIGERIEINKNLTAEEKKNKITEFILCNGIVGEWGKGALGTEEPSRIYNALVANGTTGVFCGHDHMNNSSFWVKKGNETDTNGLKLTYGMSIDYLAYPGIYKKTAQRGGRMIEINSTNSLVKNDNILQTEIDFDQQFGFTTYNIPYWQDLYKQSK